MHHTEQQKPAYFKGLLWFIFSGTAMISAFILPIHIWALSNDFHMTLRTPLFRIYFFVLIESALYHGLYRTKTLLIELGLIRAQKFIGIIITFLFVVFSGLAIWILFFTLK